MFPHPTLTSVKVQVDYIITVITALKNQREGRFRNSSIAAFISFLI